MLARELVGDPVASAPELTKGDAAPTEVTMADALKMARE